MKKMLQIVSLCFVIILISTIGEMFVMADLIDTTYYIYELTPGEKEYEAEKVYSFDPIVEGEEIYDFDLIAEDEEIYDFGFDFASAMIGLDPVHAAELINLFTLNNPNATEWEVMEHLKHLIFSNAIRLDRQVRVNWAGYVPTSIVSMGPNTSAMFNTNPGHGLNALATGHQANQRTSARWNANQHHNGNGDAFRHIYWNAIMMQVIRNENFVVRFATAWEDDGTRAGQPAQERTMDLFNNSLGVQIGRGFINDSHISTHPRIEAEAMNFVTTGRGLRIINGSTMTSTNNAGMR